MLNHTKRIKEIYEDIQREIFYMIPEKWDILYLYSSVVDMPDKTQNGELYFYYIPKGIFKKKPINVYEIPAKFNIDEKEYVKLVELLYDKIKELRREFKKYETDIWSNITISIQNLRFKVEYDYEDLNKSEFNSYERHVIWRYKYLDIGVEQVSKEEKAILKRYLTGAKTLGRAEEYNAGIYIRNIKNMVDYTKEQFAEEVEDEEVEEDEEINIGRNQILLSQDKMKKNDKNKKNC